MMFTGKTLWRAHAADGQLRRAKRRKTRPPDSQRPLVWSERMSRLGYETYFTGKWHIQADAAAVFDHSTHIRPGMPPDTRKPPFKEEGYQRPPTGKPDVWSPYDKRFGGFWEGGKHWSEVLADDATLFLRDASARSKTPSSKPFFMYLAFNAPHDPRQSPKEFVDRYPLTSIKLPPPFHAKHPHDTLGLTPTRRDESLAPYPRTEFAVKVNRQEYYALITHLDEQIGRILREVRAQGLDKNTWIIFSADHGLACGHHGLMGKQNMFDHSIRVPFIIAGPNVTSGRFVDQPIYVQDVMATCLDIAGDNDRRDVEFQSLLPLLAGEPSRVTSVYGAFMDTQRMIRRDEWKLIVYPTLQVRLLYDLRRDPHEERNVAEDPANRARMKSMFAELTELQQRLDDGVDLKRAFPQLSRD